jgi:hypothetical protein
MRRVGWGLVALAGATLLIAAPAVPQEGCGAAKGTNAPGLPERCTFRAGGGGC